MQTPEMQMAQMADGGGQPVQAIALPVGAAQAQAVPPPGGPNKCANITVMVRHTGRTLCPSCSCESQLQLRVPAAARASRERVSAAAAMLTKLSSQVFGCINIVFFLLSCLSLATPDPNIPGIILCFLIGACGTTAAALYNPCGCCGGPPDANKLKIVRARPHARTPRPSTLCPNTRCFARDCSPARQRQPKRQARTRQPAPRSGSAVLCCTHHGMLT